MIKRLTNEQLATVERALTAEGMDKVEALKALKGAALKEWCRRHTEEDRRAMATMQNFLTDVFREPCPVCARRAQKRAWAARNRTANRLKNQL